MSELRDTEIAVVGGGQAGLSLGYYLRRAGLDFVILDDQDEPGGAWRHGWSSLRLFSPASYSSLPGWMMPPTPGKDFPDAAHVVDYLTRYEQRYDLPIARPVRVAAISARANHGGFAIETERGPMAAQIVISATGTWSQPFAPDIPGRRDFTGRQLHTADYTNPEPFAGQRVAVVGGGNSGAQILAELSTVSDTTWITQRPPRFLPDDVDGRVLFQLASKQYAARQAGETNVDGVKSLGDIVMVAPVRDARARGVLQAQPPISEVTPHGARWPDGRQLEVDAIVWCTGFRPALDHLSALTLSATGSGYATAGSASTASADLPGLYLVGYGDWTGGASATLIGAGRTARDTVRELTAILDTAANITGGR